MERIAILDGVRGIAILLVVLFHFTGATTPLNVVDRAVLGVFHAGWMGVDLFFVLSGFLITRILDAAKGTPNYFQNFYLRRTARIFPLYYGFLSVVFVVVPALRGFHSPEMQHAGAHQGWLWTYTANLSGVNFGPLGHLWTLSLEEQFYLLWPLLIYFTNRRIAMRTCVWIAAADLVLRGVFVVAIGDAAQAYSLTPFRIDALAIGGWLALAVREGGVASLVRRAWGVASGALAVLVVIAMKSGGLHGGDPVMQIVGLSAGPTLFAALLVLCMRYADLPVARVVDNAVLRGFGRYSYAIYLLHGFIIQFVWGRIGNAAESLGRWSGSTLAGALPSAVVVCAACFGVGWVSWRTVERPIAGLFRKASAFRANRNSRFRVAVVG